MGFLCDNPKQATGIMIDAKTGSVKKGKWKWGQGFAPDPVEKKEGPTRLANAGSEKDHRPQRVTRDVPKNSGKLNNNQLQNRNKAVTFPLTKPKRVTNAEPKKGGKQGQSKRVRGETARRRAIEKQNLTSRPYPIIRSTLQCY